MITFISHTVLVLAMASSVALIRNVCKILRFKSVICRMTFPPLLNRFADITTHTVVTFLPKMKQQFPAAWMHDSGKKGMSQFLI